MSVMQPSSCSLQLLRAPELDALTEDRLVAPWVLRLTCVMGLMCGREAFLGTRVDTIIELDGRRVLVGNRGIVDRQPGAVGIGVVRAEGLPVHRSEAVGQLPK